MLSHLCVLTFFFFNDTATTEIYTLSLHDALPILPDGSRDVVRCDIDCGIRRRAVKEEVRFREESAEVERSEEHTSELQSRLHLVCRLLLEKKNNPRAPRRTTWGRGTGRALPTAS